MRNPSRVWLVASALLSGCLIGDETAPIEPEPPITDPTGLVREPVQGTVITGDPSTLALRVAGLYDVSDRELSVQVLSNPNDLSSWVTIGTTLATAPEEDKFAFSIEVRAVASEADVARWPLGGVLRLRVIDDAGLPLPYDATTPELSTIVVANPASLPTGWTYLLEKNPGSIAETLEYYAAINAPATLDAFMTQFGFPADETSAVYYNAGDLGIGREMHCRATLVPAGGVACYVRNYGVFGGDRGEAIDLTVAAGIPLATVAMVYTPPIDAPNSVSFLVYGGNGALVNEAQLDTFGNNVSIPQNCLNCHGGRSRYDDATNTVLGARFLPFDPSGFGFAARPDLTLVAQEAKLRQLNRLVAAAAPTVAVNELIEGMFPLDGSPYNPAFVPVGWSATPRDARVYHEVIAPYCRNCHVSFENAAANDPLTLATAASVSTRASSVLGRLCGIGPRGMPAAEQTTLHFFSSSARAVLLQWLDQPGACAPVVAP